ncbi:hypothetical protein H8959_006230 [Pygathrix nigripes]
MATPAPVRGRAAQPVQARLPGPGRCRASLGNCGATRNPGAFPAGPAQPRPLPGALRAPSCRSPALGCSGTIRWAAQPAPPGPALAGERPAPATRAPPRAALGQGRAPRRVVGKLPAVGGGVEGASYPPTTFGPPAPHPRPDPGSPCLPSPPPSSSPPGASWEMPQIGPLPS